MTLSCDVLVIGGGPAGSTVSTLLVERGFSVLLVEKDRHPRFHIGESLLPRNLPILRRLGVENRLRHIGVTKHGADFSGNEAESHVVYDFSEAMAPDEPSAFQVRRAEFDEMLLDNASERGVQVVQETRVTGIELDADPVTASILGTDGTARQISARFVVDASGRDTFLSQRLDLKQRNKRHKSAAVFGHFSNVVRREGEEAGNISIYWFDQGWFWLIPLQDGCTSVGMVCDPGYLKQRDGDLQNLFWQTVSNTQGVAQRLENAQLLGEMRGTGNFSYQSTEMTGDRFLLVGDAYAFIDPVFSSGVYLAMQGAEYAAEAVEGILTQPQAALRHRRRYERRVRKGLRAFSWFIYRFTDPALRYLFLNPTRRFQLRRAVISVLSGDVYGRTRIWPQLLVFRLVYHVTSLFFWRQQKAHRARLDKMEHTVS